MALLNIRNLTVRFATAAGSFTAVDGIDVSVDAREVLAIVGESGSGKSVSMLAVMGLLPDTATVTADEMTFDGQDLLHLSAADRRRLIGREITMIFQEPIASLNPAFTVGFQIEEVLRLNLGLSRRAARARAVELFRAVGIPEPETKIHSYPHQMSGGQCQRVMIAMAIASNPRLLIADEPTTALDVTIQKQILDLLMTLQEQHGMALILITHDMGVVAETADRVIVQYKGHKMEEADVLSLFEAPKHPYTRALLSSMPSMDPENRTLTSPLSGDPPSPIAPPSGCRFHTRCPHAKAVCAEVKPRLEAVGEGHQSACLMAQPASPWHQSIPLKEVSHVG
jgi:dipeptide transport system ATP-binding protein